MSDSTPLALEHGFRMTDDPAFPLCADAVQLAHFLADTLPRGTSVCDLGCGAGAVALLLCANRDDVTVTGVELRPAAAALAAGNSVQNRLGDRLTVLCDDVRTLAERLPAASFPAVCANPPYRSIHAGKLPQNPDTALACTELAGGIADFARTAAYLLPHGGDFYCVYPSERLTVLLDAVKAAGLEPKTLTFYHAVPSKPSCMVILRAKRGAKPGLTVLPPRFLQNAAR